MSTAIVIFGTLTFVSLFGAGFTFICARNREDKWGIWFCLIFAALFGVIDLVLIFINSRMV